jgi:MFS family permease
VGPLIGGFLTTALSWRVGFLMEAIIIAVVLSGVGLLKDVPYAGPRQIDLAGAAPSVLGMGGLVLGILVWQEGGDAVVAPLVVGVVVGVVGLGSLARFLVQGHRAGKSTLVDPRLFGGCVAFGLSAVGAYVLPASSSEVNATLADATTALGFLVGALLLIPEGAATDQ